MRWIFITLTWLVYIFITTSLLVIACNIWIITSTSDNVFFDSDKLPDYNVALVLGTSHLLADGSPNPFFNQRMETAAMLYKEGKIAHLIVSGDNRTRYYNEPAEMKKKLLQLGVPVSVITSDYAGLRTLDSIVRGKEIFGQDELVIVTQSFHGYRALFISMYYGIDAVVLASDGTTSRKSPLLHWREYFARAKAVLDLYIFKTTPRYMGEKEPLVY